MPLGNPYRALLGAAGGGATNWISLLQLNVDSPTAGGTQFQFQSNETEGGASVAVGSDGHVYTVVGSTPAYGYKVQKYTDAGVLVWQNSQLLAGTSVSHQWDVGRIAVDSTHNVYVSTRQWYTSGGNWKSYTTLIKYNAAGVLQFTREYSTNGTTGNPLGSGTTYKRFDASGLAIDSSDNVLIGGVSADTFPSGTGDSAFITKLDSSAVDVWSPNMLGFANDGTNWSGRTTTSIDTDASDNIYAGGYERSAYTGVYSKARISKWNASGTLQWQKSYAGGNDLHVNKGTPYDVYPPGVDGSGQRRQPMISVENSTGDSYMGFSFGRIIKVNNAGVHQWNQQLGVQYDIYSVDAGGDYLYFVGQDVTLTINASPDVNRTGFVGRLNASTGALDWMNKFEGHRDVLLALMQSCQLTGCKYHADGLYVVGNTARYSYAGDAMVLGKLPLDGSGTGAVTGVSVASPSGTLVYDFSYTALAVTPVGSQTITEATTTVSTMTTTGSLLATSNWGTVATATDVNVVTNI
tara:strand:+ start:1256 stop:2818 length:1563 start_codon:yes stop_codon:yes gene_type:complete